MYALLLQDWVTIRSGSGNAVTQGEAAWLDMSAFLDVTVFMETKNFATSAGNLMMGFQTSPTKDEVLFQTMNDISSTTGTSVALGVQTFVLLRDTALCPLAHWLRWQLTPISASSFESTFRIWVAANQPGGYAQSSLQSEYGTAGGGPAYTIGPASGQGKWNKGVLGQIPQILGPGPQTGPMGPAAPGYLDSGFKGIGYIPKVKSGTKDWRQGISQIVQPTTPARVPFLPPGTKSTK